jgi:DNA-binding winged helix-turn-helix (wHTH) protein
MRNKPSIHPETDIPSRTYHMVINFVQHTDGAPLSEHIPVPSGSQAARFHTEEFMFKISSEALPPVGVDMYVVPAERTAEFLEAGEDTDVPVIAYGPPSLLQTALEAGCRDYLKEPWDYGELKARASRLLVNRRFYFQWGQVHYLAKSLRCGAAVLALSPPEDCILGLLSAHINRTVHRDALQYALWGKPRPGSRAVDTHISSLRKKFNLLAGKTLNPSPLRSVHGRGYSLVHNLSTPYSGCG